MRIDYNSIPDNLPIPGDDGAASHLLGQSLPKLRLHSTSDRLIDLSELTNKIVFFFYPRTGRPDEPAPVGWDEIPGARGCTPQSCGYRDFYGDFQQLGVSVFGVSTQSTAFQKELVQRIRLPFEILSDSEFAFTDSMALPTFEYNGMRLLKRMSWVYYEGKIAKVFYPVFPPDRNASQVIEWIRS
jgi:peroxiredoxin